VRGDDVKYCGTVNPAQGPAPRARRTTPSSGTRPACSRDHPRLRGLQRLPPRQPKQRRTTSRTRGRLHARHDPQRQQRSTPRARDDIQRSYGLDCKRGPPPHARGRRWLAARANRAGGTPACARTTHSERSYRRSASDHPRLRGDDGLANSCVSKASGQLPLLRETLLVLYGCIYGPSPVRGDDYSRGDIGPPRVREDDTKIWCRVLVWKGPPVCEDDQAPSWAFKTTLDHPRGARVTTSSSGRCSTRSPEQTRGRRDDKAVAERLQVTGDHSRGRGTTAPS
jgi:hypothetical protein